MSKIDLSYLETISGGDKSFIDDMLKMFLTNTFPEVEQLKKHAEEKQWELMGGTAHKMKAPIQMLGVPKISAMVIELEQIGKTQSNTDDVVSKIDILKDHIKVLETEINQYLQA
jgi:HPt (histidine-containing phosphotransfer) domain-containing protein